MLAKSFLAASVLMALAGASVAQDASMFKVSGFGTVAATTFSRTDIDFVGDRSNLVGAGHSNQISFNPDSKLGLQVQFNPNDALQFTVQGVSRMNARGNWAPSLEWANVKYNFNDTAAVRVGRIGHPFFMISDYRQVNYTNVALRPSVEVYHQVPMTHSDVVEGLLKFDVAGGQLGLQGGVGRIDAEGYGSLPSERDYDTVKVRDMKYINATFEKGNWTVRAGHTEGDLTYDALSVRRGLFERFAAVPGMTAARSALEIKDAKSTFSGIGAMYDDGKYVFNAEYVMQRSSKAYNDTDAWMALLGYHVGKFTPYVSYANSKSQGRVIAPATVSAAVNAQLQAFADSTLNNQTTTSIGVRWDVYKNMALKAQYDHVSVGNQGSNGFLFNRPGVTGYPAGGDGDVFAVSLDFIF